MTSDPGAVVLLPFPFVDRPVSKLRPALVLSAQTFNDTEQQTILAMITTAAASRWVSDHTITDWSSAGLRTPCVVRMKLFTLENRIIVRALGRLSAGDWWTIQRVVRSVLPLSGEPAAD